MEKAFSYRFYPTSEQETLLRRTLGCVRLVYNRALDARTEGWYQRQQRISYAETSAMLTLWKQEEELQFLNEVSCVPLQQVLRHLQTAYTNFFAGRAKYPNYKKKRNGGSAEFTKSAFKWKDGKVFLAKCLEPLTIQWSRQLPDGAEPSTVTVRLNPAGQWYISIRSRLRIPGKTSCTKSRQGWCVKTKRSARHCASARSAARSPSSRWL